MKFMEQKKAYVISDGSKMIRVYAMTSDRAKRKALDNGFKAFIKCSRQPAFDYLYNGCDIQVPDENGRFRNYREVDNA